MDLRTELRSVIGSMLTVPVAAGTLEHQFLEGCVEGMATGHTFFGCDEPSTETRLTNPGAVDMLAREAEKLTALAGDDVESDDDYGTPPCLSPAVSPTTSPASPSNE